MKTTLIAATILAGLASVQGAAEAPDIHAPAVFGVRPGAPVLFTIPATGARPLHFSAVGLPASLHLNSETGIITGKLDETGTVRVKLSAKNEAGGAEKELRITVGDRIALTPPMGWSSWNCFGRKISQDLVLRQAKAMVDSGLSQHGYTYINIDDGWQGERTGPAHALGANEKFPDLRSMVGAIHAMGLKAGIYSTPWESSYAGFCGGSAQDTNGKWEKGKKQFGAVSFAREDAQYFAALGFDYLKYDWNPLDIPHVREMREALLATGRDIVFSLSNGADLKYAAEYASLAELWRTTGDLVPAFWKDAEPDWAYSITETAFTREKWAPFSGPGHWNDPDMLVLGKMTLANSHKSSKLTPEQEKTHFTMWCLLAAPLILGCDLEELDSATLSVITNDEVIAIDQDELGIQAVRVGANGPIDFYAKRLADGSHALGIVNRSSTAVTTGIRKLRYMGLPAKARARDLWRLQEIPDFDPNKTTFTVPGDGVVLLRLWPSENIHANKTATEQPLQPPAKELLRDVRRIVFLGDSITQAGDYVVDINCWLLRHGVAAEVLNLGLGSETASDLTPEENAGHDKKYGFGHPFLSERMARILAATKPDLLVACYGMNDCGCLPPDDSGTRRFGEAVTRLRDHALKAGAKHVVICTPPVHDNKQDAATDPADQNLARYTAWLLSQRNDGWLVADIHTPMRAALDKARAAQRDFVFAKDGVHPGREGHWLMARQILQQAFGADVDQVSSAEELFPAHGTEIRGLVQERMKLLASAWLTKTGHQRPHVPGGPDAPLGPSLAEAEGKAKEITAQIYELLHAQFHNEINNN
jgi:alpha-galactosidase